MRSTWDLESPSRKGCKREWSYSETSLLTDFTYPERDTWETFFANAFVFPPNGSRVREFAYDIRDVITSVPSAVNRVRQWYKMQRRVHGVTCKPQRWRTCRERKNRRSKKFCFRQSRARARARAVYRRAGEKKLAALPNFDVHLNLFGESWYRWTGIYLSVRVAYRFSARE